MTVIMVLLVVYCRIANGNGNVNGAGGSSIINTCGDVNDLWKDKPSLGQDLSENIYILVCSSQSQNAEMDQAA